MKCNRMEDHMKSGDEDDNRIRDYRRQFRCLLEVNSRSYYHARHKKENSEVSINKKFDSSPPGRGREEVIQHRDDVDCALGLAVDRPVTWRLDETRAEKLEDAEDHHERVEHPEARGHVVDVVEELDHRAPRPLVERPVDQAAVLHHRVRGPRAQVRRECHDGARTLPLAHFCSLFSPTLNFLRDYLLDLISHFPTSPFHSRSLLCKWRRIRWN